MNEQPDRSGRKREQPDPRARHGDRSQRRPSRGRPGTSGKAPAPTDQYIYGLHAAEFALRNPAREIQVIWATENAERKLADAIATRRLPVQPVTPRDLDKRVGADTVHQGINLQVAPLATLDLADLAESAIASNHPIIVLDHVTDPHNVGAVLRSGAVFGAAGIVMTQRHSPPLGSTLAKAASGALDLLPVCLVQNLAKTLVELQRQSFTVIGLDGLSEHRLLEEGLAERRGEPLVLAFGAEGKGLRELTGKSCNELCRIGGDGPIDSLNVSNAAAIALHLAAMQRRDG